MYFINQQNPINGACKQKARIVDTLIFGDIGDEVPKWKYTIEFGTISYDPRGLSDGPMFTKSNGFFSNIGIAYAYNKLEIGNTQTRAYGYKLTGEYKEESGDVPDGFTLTDSPTFLFTSVPVGAIVDVEIDSNGFFYFSEQNNLYGTCGG